MIADWWQGNVSGQPKIAYELSNDNNYSREVYSSVEGIIGEARYNELCKLDEWSRALVFNDRHSGYPTVQITVNSSDKSEARRLQRILESITRRHILSYGDPANAKFCPSGQRIESYACPCSLLRTPGMEKKRLCLIGLSKTVSTS